MEVRLPNLHTIISQDNEMNAAAGQECPAYRIFEIAPFIPDHRPGHSEPFS